MKITKNIIFYCCILFIFNSCNSVKNITNAITNFANLKFKLGTVNDFKINNINISKINKITDVSVTDAFNITQSVASKQLPVQFTLNVIANNPNASSKNTIGDAVISNFDWQLFVDDVQTIQGNISSPIKIPAGKNTITIPISMQLDLYKFFGNKGYENLINLALAVGGASGSASRLKLKAKPTINIGGIPIAYPNYITIVDTEFRDK